MKKVLVISLLLVFVTAFVSCNAVNVDFFALDDEHYVTDLSMGQNSTKLIDGKNSFARFVAHSDSDIEDGFEDFTMIEIGVLIAENVSRVNIDRVGKVGKTLKIYVSYPNNAYKSDSTRVMLIKKIAVPKESVEGVTSVRISLRLY